VRGAIFGGELPVNLGTITAYARRIYGRRTKWTCETVPSAACDPHGVACNLYRVLDDSGGERFILQVKGATSHEAMRAALGALMGIEIERRRVAKVRA
jgi:hypothetical protein